MKKIEEKKDLGVPTPPEDETICLFAGLLANPDMPLIHLILDVVDIFSKNIGTSTTVW